MDHKIKDPKHIFLNKDKCNKNAKETVLLGMVGGISNTHSVWVFSDNSDINDANKHVIFKEYSIVSQVCCQVISSQVSKYVLCK